MPGEMNTPLFVPEEWDDQRRTVKPAMVSIPRKGPRILVTGSRDWDDEEAIWAALSHFPAKESTLVSGGCPTGADAIAEEYAQKAGWCVERHPADWNAHGKAAGFIRNSHMVSLGADGCIAFIRNKSKGATHTANIAEKAGIPTVRVTKK